MHSLRWICFLTVKNPFTKRLKRPGCSNFAPTMKKAVALILIFFYLFIQTATVSAQCSVCTKTALQMGDKPARALNTGIIYLMLTPFLIVGFIGYRWWRGNKQADQEIES